MEQMAFPRQIPIGIIVTAAWDLPIHTIGAVLQVGVRRPTKIVGRGGHLNPVTPVFLEEKRSGSSPRNLI
jgi:hypothetical protein